MVIVHPRRNALLARGKLFDALHKIGLGRDLTLRRHSRTMDEYGQLSSITTTDYSFFGDLQSGLDLDEKLIKIGMVDIGEGVLYILPTDISIEISPEDLVIDGNAQWEVLARIQIPFVQGVETMHTFRCKRRINSSDS